MCYSIATAPKIVYKEQLNSISLKKFHETDQSFYSTLVKATRNMWGFPKALFHLPPSLGGYGILSTVDRTMLSKWSSLHSALYANDDHSIAAEGLLHRMAAIQGIHLLEGQGVILQPPTGSKDRWWLSSLLEWGQHSAAIYAEKAPTPTTILSSDPSSQITPPS
jgi:hypothetical protein